LPVADTPAAGAPASPDHQSELAAWQAAHPQLRVQVDRIAKSVEEGLPLACHREQPDLVVLGATGTYLDAGVLGESTAQLARHLECPLLVIEKPPRLPIRRVLFVSDFSKPEAAVFQRMLSLIGVYSPTIHLLYVKHSQYLNMPLILADSVMRDFEELALPLDCHSHVGHGGNVSNAVNKYIDSLDIDLVVLGNQPRSLFYRLITEDVLARVLRHTDTPVLIVPRYGEER
jgi:nucleotide-binding universal stress UspA family protein